MDFPEEIYLLILNQCNLVDLKKFLSVSEEFRQMILTTPRLMRKLKVIFYRTDWKDKIPFVEKNGNHVRSVMFDTCETVKAEDVERILSFTPYIENLELLLCIPTEEEDDAVEVTKEKIELNLKALKLLRIASNDKLTKALMFSLRNCRNVEKFSGEAYSEQPVSEVGNFLSEQQNLQEIEIKGNGSDLIGLKTVFTEKLMSNKNLQLKKLVLLTGLEYNKEFSDFLKEQSKNIEALEIRSYSIDFHFYRLVFKYFHNLKKICFTVHTMLNEARCIELADYSLPSVTEFETDDYVDDATAFFALIKLFPNLEIIVTPVSTFPFHGILDKLSKLKKIKASSFKLEKMMYARSSSLQELELNSCDFTGLSCLWKKFAEDFPNIEKIVMKDVAAYQLPKTRNLEVEIILNNLRNFKQLKYFELWNDVDNPPQFSSDHDNQVVVNIAQNIFSFKLLLKRKIDGSIYLKFSNYFSQYQTKALENIKNDYNISEVVEEN